MDPKDFHLGITSGLCNFVTPATESIWNSGGALDKTKQ